jgi:hypothetical protein
MRPLQSPDRATPAPRLVREVIVPESAIHASVLIFAATLYAAAAVAVAATAALGPWAMIWLHVLGD